MFTIVEDHEDLEFDSLMEEETEFRQVHELRFLADLYMQAQKIRIANENRKRSLDQGADDGYEAKFLEDLIFRFSDIEDVITKRMSKAIQLHPTYYWLKHVKGIGGVLATKLIGYLPQDIESFSTVSKLWRYCGLAVIDGKAEKNVKGEKSHFSTKLKTVLYLIATSMIKSRSPYRRIYDDAKAYYTANRPEWTKLRVHYASLRKMEKVFICHLWEVWREALNLPLRELYVHDKLGHESKFKKEEFVTIPVPVEPKKRGRKAKVILIEE